MEMMLSALTQHMDFVHFSKWQMSDFSFREGGINVLFPILPTCAPTLCDPMDCSPPGSSVHSVQFSSIQSLSCVWLFSTPWTAARQASLSITNSQSPPKPMSIESVMPSNHLILCCPLLLLPLFFPSIRVFLNESALYIRCPKYWSFSFNISPSNEHSGLISFRMDWLDILVVQGTLKSLLQHHSSKASVLRCSAFFIVQLSHPYMTTGKTIALTRQTFVDKVMSLLFNMLSRLVITFLPRSKPQSMEFKNTRMGCPSRGSSQSRDLICMSCVFCIGRQILYHCATWEAPILPTKDNEKPWTLYAKHL